MTDAVKISALGICPPAAALTGYDAVLGFSDQEKRHLGAYLRTDGLLFADDVRPDRPGVRSRDVGTRDTPFDRQLKARYGLNSLLWAPT